MMLELNLKRPSRSSPGRWGFMRSSQRELHVLRQEGVNLHRNSLHVVRVMLTFWESLHGWLPLLFLWSNPVPPGWG